MDDDLVVPLDDCSLPWVVVLPVDGNVPSDCVDDPGAPGVVSCLPDGVVCVPVVVLADAAVVEAIVARW